jgi:hypothetical protein
MDPRYQLVPSQFANPKKGRRVAEMGFPFGHRSPVPVTHIARDRLIDTFMSEQETE